MADQDVTVIVKGKNNAKPALDSAAKDVQNFAKTSSSGVSSLMSSFKALGGVLATLGAVKIFKDIIASTNEHIRVQTQLQAVLTSTRGAVGLTAEEITRMAISLQNVTAIEDDVIITGQNMLLTFTNIGKDVFPQATQALLDMTTSMNSGAIPTAEQLKSQAIQLGKALNNPVEGISALTRVGVQFTEQQKQQIEVLMESGRTMEAQRIILAELAKEFGGSAAAQAQTFEGRIAKMKITIDNLYESIGMILIPVLDVLMTVFASLINVIGNVIEFLKNHHTVTLILAASITVMLLPALGALATLIWATVIPALIALAIAFAPFLIAGAIIVGIVGGLTKLGKKFEWIGNIVSTVGGWIKKGWHATMRFLGIESSNGTVNAGNAFRNLTGLIRNEMGAMTRIVAQQVAVMKLLLSSLPGGTGVRALKGGIGGQVGVQQNEQVVAAGFTPTFGGGGGGGGGGAMDKAAEEAQKALEDAREEHLKFIEQQRDLRDSIQGVKDDFKEMSVKVGDSLLDLGAAHEKTMAEIQKQIEATKSSIASLTKEYEKQVQGFDESAGERVVKQEELLASLKEELKEKKNEEEYDREGVKELEDRIAKEQTALNSFLVTNTDLQDEIDAAREKSGLTEFERFALELEEKRAQAEEKFQIEKTNLEKILLEQELQKDREIALYEEKKQAFLLIAQSIQDSWANTTMKMGQLTQDFVDLSKSQFDSISGALSSVGSLSGDETSAGVLRNFEGLAGGNSSQNVQVSFGDINIAKDVDADQFMGTLEKFFARKMQLSNLGSI